MMADRVNCAMNPFRKALFGVGDQAINSYTPIRR